MVLCPFEYQPCCFYPSFHPNVILFSYKVGVVLIDVGTFQECAVKDLYVLPDCVRLDTHPALACPRAMKGVVSCYHNSNNWFSCDLEKIEKLLSQRLVSG